MTVYLVAVDQMYVYMSRFNLQLATAAGGTGARGRAKHPPIVLPVSLLYVCACMHAFSVCIQL